MHPMTKLKINELAEELNDILHTGKRADIAISRLINEFKALLEINPKEANLGLALIYTRYHQDKTNALHYQKAAVSFAGDDHLYMYNYASALYLFEEFDAARKYLALALENVSKPSPILDDIAKLAQSLHAQDMFHDIIKKANEFNFTSQNINFIACEIALANADSDEEVLEILHTVEAKDGLFEGNQGIFATLDDEKWESMKSLADELR